ncbi:MAG: aldo/keto reductase [Nitrospinae bacterium]|nr:aldo/keto reductase [Nitrospinota bacterium]
MLTKEAFREGVLGRTGRKVLRLGLAGGYGVSAEGVEMAVERGVNYLYHGSIRRDGMTQAIKNLTGKGKREQLIIVAQIYWREWAWPFNRSFYSFLKNNGLEYVDVLLLGWHNGPPSQKTLDICSDLKVKGLFRHLAISGHNRKAFPEFAASGLYDAMMTRYNAVHRGAEDEIFPHIDKERSVRPAITTYTTTCWGQLLKSGNTPSGEATPKASDCYRFVMSNPTVDVCMSGPKNMDELKEALSALDKGEMSEAEMKWMRKVGDYIHSGKAK